MAKFRGMLRALRFHDEDGQGLVEYGLLLALITVLCFLAFTNFSSSTTSLVQRVSNSVTSVS